jgi:hypothetical protein
MTSQFQRYRGMHLSAVLLALLSSIANAQSFCAPVTAEPTASATLLGNGTPGSVSTPISRMHSTPAARSASTSAQYRPQS